MGSKHNFNKRTERAIQEEAIKAEVNHRVQFQIEYEWLAYLYGFQYESVLDIGEKGIKPIMRLIPMSDEDHKNIGEHLSKNSIEKYREMGLMDVEIPDSPSESEKNEKGFEAAFQKVKLRYGLTFFSVITQGPGGSFIPVSDLRKLLPEEYPVGPVESADNNTQES